MTAQHWRKLGRIYAPDPAVPQRKLYGILPTPQYLPDQDAIRVYFAATGDDRVGRIFAMTVDASDPTRVLEPAGEPLLEPGPPGAFDDCGANPSSIVEIDGAPHLYYVGYQRSVVSPYLLFTGVAVSRGGSRFERYANVPVFERTTSEYIIRSAPSVHREDGGYRAWYVSASGWEHMTAGIFAGRMMPVYVIRHARSRDGLQWVADPDVCIGPRNEDEFGFGRPWVIRDGGLYRIYFSRRTRSTPYRIGCAESEDGLHWTRRDEDVRLDVSEEGWDSEMVCYAAVIPTKHGTYMFYNGNRNGETGFGCAVLLI